MKAIVQDRYGSADVLALREVPGPALTDDRVLLRVQAASVNPLDWHLMRASPFLVRLSTGLRRPEPAIRGVDVAGRVDAVGSVVTRFAPGDEVFAQGEIRSMIDRRYPLAEAAGAIRYVEQGHSQGKVVISMGARDEA